MSAKYTFLPYYRKGLINRATAPASGRPEVSVKLTLNTGDDIEKSVQLTAPRDITGLNRAAIIKTYPTPNSLDMTPGDLAYVEFDAEDLPWRFTPGAPVENRLKPWLMLLAFKEGEFEENFQSLPLPSFSILSGPFKEMDFEDAWAFAHVQLHPTDASGGITDPLSFIQENPDRCLSRILCPRRLDASTRYTAFLVPAFLAGQLAGLGQDPDDEDIDTPASPEDEDGPRPFPYYYRWTFTTAPDGDFETMARRLKPVSSEDIELPTLDISNLQQTSTAPLAETELPMPSLFMPPNKSIGVFTDQTVKEELIKKLERQQDGGGQSEAPIINFLPFYGRNYTGQSALSAIGNDWLSTINLDPRYRAIAQIGRKIVRENQETFMDWAWDLAGDALEELNQKIKRAQFSSRLSQRVWDKHVAPRTGDELLGYSRPLHSKINVDTEGDLKTLAHRVAHSVLSRGASDPAFRKVVRKAKVNTENRSIGAFISQMRENELRAAGDKLPLSVIPLIENMPDPEYLGGEESARENIKMVYDRTRNDLPLHLNQESATFSNLLDILRQATDPIERQKKLLEEEFTLEDEDLDTLTPFGISLSFSGVSLYNYFKEATPNLIFPKVNEVPADSVMLLEPNRAFIESLMLGVNQEMSEELKWREFPCSLTDTYFRQFWDYTDSLEEQQEEDISPIHEWDAGTALGTHLEQGQSDGLIVLVKSRLLEKFPNTVLYLRKAAFVDLKWQERELSDEESAVLYPTFRAPVEPDMLMVRFEGADVNADAVKGNDNDPGWFFVLEERPGEVRFGLDQYRVEEEETIDNLTSWNNLSWEHVPDEVLSHDSISRTIDGVTWGTETDSAQLAWILLQRPVQLAIHGSDLID